MAFPAPPRMVVRPGRGLGGTVTAPGDKSITHRAFLLGALADGETLVQDSNPGADCDATLGCLESLGVQVHRRPHEVSLLGSNMRLRPASRPLDCGNSGTTLRLLAGVLAGQPFRSTLIGDASLQRRPVDRIIDPLRRMGARLSAREGDRFPPLEIEGGVLQGIRYRVPTHSAQVASCVLLAGLQATGTTTVELGAARDHTERMLPAFGVPVLREGEPGDGAWASPRAVTGPARLKGTRLRIPGDFSAAAFFLVGAAITPGARVEASAVGVNPTRTGLLRLLERMGARVEVVPRSTEAGEPVGDVIVTGPERLEATDVPAEWIPTLLDEIPIWAMAASLAQGVSKVQGAGELRVKESDRLSALATNLRRLGVRVEEHPDGISIEGGSVTGGQVNAAGDHRIAMAFAVLGTRAGGPIEVTGTREIATSNPGFVAALRRLGADVETPEAETLER